jgi:outer membrane protein
MKGNLSVKKYFVMLLIFFACSAFMSAQTQKLGYVDSQVILSQFPDAIKAQGDLEAISSSWSAHLDSIRANYQQALADYQKKANTMPENEKQAAQQKLVSQENDVVGYNRLKFAQGTGEIYKKQDEIFGPVKSKIYKAIKDVAQKEDVKFVFDKAGDAVLLYADSAADLTYKVLDYLKTSGK